MFALSPTTSRGAREFPPSPHSTQLLFVEAMPATRPKGPVAVVVPTMFPFTSYRLTGTPGSAERHVVPVHVHVQVLGAP